jgi:medium-chain acyl-[acyl-carrier-protein] hydrolase
MEAPRDTLCPGSTLPPGRGAAPAALEEAFLVRLFESDAQGALSAGGLCNYLQEAAGDHAAALGVSVAALMQRGLTWVLSRLRLRIVRLPAAGETVRVRTWPTGAEKLFALRDFQVLDAGGACIASAVSAWLILDTTSRRPVRVQSVFDPPDVSGISRGLDIRVERLPAAQGLCREAPVVVRLSDLDANAHANNARISEWIIESVGKDTFARDGIRGLDIDFLAEAMHGDTLLSRAVELPGPAFSHSLVRPADGREIARARTAWESRRSRT